MEILVNDRNLDFFRLYAHAVLGGEKKMPPRDEARFLAKYVIELCQYIEDSCSEEAQ